MTQGIGIRKKYIAWKKHSAIGNQNVYLGQNYKSRPRLYPVNFDILVVLQLNISPASYKHPLQNPAELIASVYKKLNSSVARPCHTV